LADNICCLYYCVSYSCIEAYERSAKQSDVCHGDTIYTFAFLLLVYRNPMQWLSRESIYLVLLLVTGFDVSFLSFNLKSEYKVFYKLMCWLAGWLGVSRVDSLT